MTSSKIITISGITTALVLLFASKKNTNKLAESLYKQWKGIKEDNKTFYNTLFTFWKNLGYSDEKAKRYIKDSTPWSAAFISYIMTKGGMTNFPKSASHTCFASKIKKGSYDGLSLKRVGEYAPKVGDIVIRNRVKKLTFDSFKCGDPSHSDIVVQVLPGKLITIGGNISNSIAKTVVRTNSRGLISNNNYFAIIKVNQK